MLNGCITALVTPMFDDETIDFESLDILVDWQIENGVIGLVANGSTGEAANLSTKETIDIIERIIAKAAGRVKIIVGAGTASTATSLKFLERINEINGIDYIMCLTPYYVKPTQEGLYRHFGLMADKSKHPVILYNVPGRTGCNLEDSTVLRLAADYKNIVGLKDATGDIPRVVKFISEKPKDFILLSGDDCTILPFISSGGNGVISVVSNIRPRQISELCAFIHGNKREKAIELNNNLVKLYDSCFWEANPIPVKWALYHENRMPTPTLRMPLTTFSDTYHESMSKLLQLTK
ncbi:MAG: 4-hydroxy-tetrahydrodipicolinate synthase [Burkholderiales bacterium]|nr:4-hydroxy-tetrahydrodipicolinate synthase [Burkholderiales bacterium]